MEQLPIQLDCFLMTWGFFESGCIPATVPVTGIPQKPKRRSVKAKDFSD